MLKKKTTGYQTNNKKCGCILQPFLFAHHKETTMAVWSIDIETTGLVPWTDSILGIGVACSSQFSDTKYYTGKNARGIVKYIHDKQIQVVGHNITFDKGWLDYHFPEYPLRWIADTGVLSQMYDNSDAVNGFGLKDSAQRLLGVDAHEEELLNWVLENVPEAKKSKYRAYMALVPEEIVAKYCRYDCLYTFRLWELLSNQVKDWSVYMSLFLSEVDATIQQQRYGIKVDLGGVTKYYHELTAKLAAVESEFLTHPEIAPHIAKVQTERWEKEFNDKLAKSKTKRVKVKPFVEWCEKNPFNPNSDTQLRLVFDSQGVFFNPISKQFQYPFLTPTGKPSLSSDFIGLYGVGGRILAKQGEVGSLAMHCKHMIDETFDNRVHPSINLIGSKSGRVTASGMNLIAVPFDERDYASNLLADEGCLFFTSDIAALEPTVAANLSGDTRLTITCTPLDAPPEWDADGFLCVDDLYLLVGSKTSFASQAIKDKVDVLQWFKDGGDSAKKLLKEERAMLKAVCLAVNYGAGAKKIQMTIFQRTKQWLPLIQIQETLDMYYQAFPRVRAYGQKLANLSQKNGQFVNPFGFPISFSPREMNQDDNGEVVPKFYKANNRMIQSTAQGCMKLWISELWKRVRCFQPGQIRFTLANFHDAFFLHVAESHVDVCKELVDESLFEVNRTLATLGWQVPLRATSAFGQNMYAAKVG
jgi:DNA polymerase I-like protein with 3'-5' exonuclease and polymerase domains